MFSVYKIMTNDGFEYIGQSKNVPTRIQQHLKDSEKSSHMEKGFTVSILKSFPTRELALDFEKELVTLEYINRSDTINSFVGGSGGFDHITLEQVEKGRQTRLKHGPYKNVVEHLKKYNTGRRGSQKPKQAEAMKRREDKGVSHLSSPEIRLKALQSQRTSEMRELRSKNAGGRKAYNDGSRNYRLRPGDSLIEALGLVPGVLKINQ